MRLTDSERLLLYNQYELLKQLDSQHAQTYERNQVVVASGFEGEYSRLAPIDFSGMLSPEDCSFVAAATDMYWILQMHARRVHFADPRLAFPGFDGNNEGGMLGYARFITEETGAFEGFVLQHGSLNSHMPVAARYERMLAVFQRELRERDGDLSAHQIRSVLDAGWGQ